MNIATKDENGEKQLARNSKVRQNVTEEWHELSHRKKNITRNMSLIKYYPYSSPINELFKIFDADLYTQSSYVEQDKEYLLNVELPGYKKENVSVELKDQAIVVKASRKGGEVKTFSYALYDDVDLDSVEATLEDGLLTVKLPKTKNTKNKVILIR